MSVAAHYAVGWSVSGAIGTGMGCRGGMDTVPIPKRAIGQFAAVWSLGICSGMTNGPTGLGGSTTPKTAKNMKAD